MAKGAKNIKNHRAKTTRRAKSNTTRYRTLTFRDDNVRKLWDKKKTIAENYTRLGLVSDPNGAAVDALNTRPRKAGEKAAKQQLAEVDFVDVTAHLRDPSLDFTRRGANFLAESARVYFKRLVRKYGDDYAKMAADAKINPKQCVASLVCDDCY